MKVAVVGSGIAGLATAYILRQQHEVVVFEAADRLGGHTCTVRVDLADETHNVDCGFIVHNQSNYPLLTHLFEELGVATQDSEMTFSVSNERSGLEWNSTNLATIFAQPKNAFQWSFLKMLLDIVRVNKHARALLQTPVSESDPTLGEFLDQHGLGGFVVDNYMVPLGSAIWSANPTTFTNFPARALFQFLDNHGLLAVRGRPTWRSVVGGSSTYVERLIPTLNTPLRLSTPVVKIQRNNTGVEVIDINGNVEHCDHVVLACHNDQVLPLLANPTVQEQSILSSFRYQPNIVTLHTDRKMLPKTRRAWASWNYHVSKNAQTLPTVTYYMNKLQRLQSGKDIMVTLNRQHEIDDTQILRQFEMAHPVYDQKAVSAQHRMHEIQGIHRVWFASAGWGHGFHEDGMRSAVSVTSGLGVQW